MAVCQFIGGVVGVLAMVWLRQRSPGSLPWHSLELACLPFGLIATASMRMLQGARYSWVLYICAQLIQIGFGSIKSLVWKCCAGPFVFLLFQNHELGIRAGVDVTLLVGQEASTAIPSAGINVVPLIILIAMLRYRSRMPRRKSSVFEAPLAN